MTPESARSLGRDAPEAEPVVAARPAEPLLRGRAGTAWLRLLGYASRRRLVPQTTAATVAARVASLARDTPLIIGRTLGPSTPVRLQLDLRCSGCLELLLAPRPGMNDPGTLALLLELARHAAVALDIGANVGLYTYLLAAAVPDIRILSVEPVAELAALITDNVHRNDWGSRAVVHETAVGATCGTSRLYILPTADTEHTLNADRIAGRDHKAVSVPVVTVDKLLADLRTPLDRVVVKIDVEGAERSVLDGMQRTLQTPGRRPDVIMEFLGQAIHDGTLERVIATGMDVYYIGPSDITRIQTTSNLAPVHTLGYWNFLLTSRPPDEVSALWARAVRGW